MQPSVIRRLKQRTKLHFYRLSRSKKLRYLSSASIILKLNADNLSFYINSLKQVRCSKGLITSSYLLNLSTLILFSYLIEEILFPSKRIGS